MSERKRVVIAGAGFAGLRIAQGLQDTADVTLVAPTDRFVYLPLIHEVVSENVEPKAVYRRLADALPNVNLVYGRAARVDGKELVTAADERYPFDDLVVAVGAEPNDFGVKGVAENALTFYSLGDSLRANATLKTIAAGLERDEPLRVTVVGASFTGVEVAGEIAEILDRLEVPREVVLLDALPEIFSRQSEEFRESVHAGIDRLDLDLRTGQKITAVEPDKVLVEDPEGGEPEVIKSHVTFWCAGVKPRGLDGVDPTVKSTLQSVERDDVWIAGDAARFPREKGVPKLAQTAEEQAKVVVHNILNPESPKEYEADVKGLILSIGHNYAVAELKGGRVFKGLIPWHLKRQLYKAKIALTM